MVATLPNGKHIRLKRVNLDERTGLSSKGCDMKKAAERMVRGASIVASPKMTAAGSGVQGAAVAAPKASATTYRNPNDLMTMLNNGACYINGVSTQAESLVTFHDDYCYTEFTDEQGNPLDKVDFQLPAITPTSDPSVFFMDPYGKNNPYYNDFVESKMTETGYGMFFDCQDPNDVCIPAMACNLTITWDDGTTESIYMMTPNYYYCNLMGMDLATVKQASVGGYYNGKSVMFPNQGGVCYTTPQLLDLADTYTPGTNVFEFDTDGDYGFDLPGEKADDELPPYYTYIAPVTYTAFDGSCPVYIECGSLIKSLGFAFCTGATMPTLMQSDNAIQQIFQLKQIDAGYQAPGQLTFDSGETFEDRTLVYVMMLAGDANGNVKDCAIAEFVGYPQYNDALNFKSLGRFTMTDGLMGDIYPDYANRTYTVEVQEHISKKGLYRIVDPYADVVNEYGEPWRVQAYADKHFFIYIDATDPNAVVMLTSPIGIDPYPGAGEGECEVSSKAAYQMDFGEMTLEECKSNRLCGKMVDKVITFPKEALVLRNNGYYMDNWQNANRKGAFKLDMSKEAGIESVAAVDPENEANAPAQYFDLQGRELTEPAGLCIERRGTKVSKVLR